MPRGDIATDSLMGFISHLPLPKISDIIGKKNVSLPGYGKEIDCLP